MIERVQNKFLHHCAWKIGFNHKDYTYQLIRNILGLDSLEIRRTKAEWVFIYKVFNGNIDYSKLLSLFSINYRKRILRSNPIFSVNLHRINYGFFHHWRECPELLMSIADL